MEPKSSKPAPKPEPARELDPASLLALARAAGEAQATVEGAHSSTVHALQALLQNYVSIVENVSEGLCCFDAEQRLILSNARYAEIYRLSPEDTKPGMTLREIVERRAAAGSWSTPVDQSIAEIEELQARAEPRSWVNTLPDGRLVKINHRPLPGGGWLSSHIDITDSQSASDERMTLQTVIDWVPDNLWVKDTHSRFVICNKATAERMGLAVAAVIGKSDRELCPPETAQGYLADEQRVIETGQPMIDKEEYVLSPNGQMTWILTTKVPLRNERGEIFGVVGVSRDISDRRRADLLRAGQAQILEQIAVGAPLETAMENLVRLVELQIPGTRGVVLLADAAGEHLRVCAAPNIDRTFVTALDNLKIGPDGLSSGTAVHRRQPVVVTDMLNDPLWADRRELVAAHAYRSCWSIPIVSPDDKPLGALTFYSQTTEPPTDEEFKIGEAAVHIAGIAIERKDSEERIRFMATHDSLTGLPNRALLKDRIDQALRFAQRSGHWATVVFIDLDNFKIINDTLGHNAGDELLKAVAERMVSCLRGVDTVVRLGGDEFVVLLVDQPRSPDVISATINKLQAAIVAPLDIAGQTLRVTCSIGAANYPGDGVDADALLANADAAMYRAKDLGRDNFQFYTPDLNVKVRDEFLLQEALRTAVERREFILHYQPQVDMTTGAIFAVEALIRWNHPTLGLMPPNRFIPIADKTGMIVGIGDWVLHEACRQNKEWQDAGLPKIKVSVNVSARQFAERNFTARVEDALKSSGLEAKYLELELTESLIMRDTALAIDTMNALQRLGIQLAIDDFGIGYSSLSALKTFPVARLKIDKSFIKGLPTSMDDRAVTTAVISLGKKLNLRIIAEGVENDEQMEFLRENKCDELQGFRFSEPIPPAAIEEFLRGTRKGKKA